MSHSLVEDCIWATWWVTQGSREKRMSGVNFKPAVSMCVPAVELYGRFVGDENLYVSRG
jgi:hypothetical protein